MKKLSLMVILSVLTIVFSTPASFAKDVPEDKYTVPTKAEFSQIQQVLGNADIQTGNLKKDNGVIVNKPDEKVGIISDISDKKDAWSHVRFHSYYVDLNSDTLIADIRFTLKQNDDRTSTTEYKNVTNGGKYVVKHDKKGNVIYEKTTGDMSILWRY
ncbi:hypothetical protein [Bacillus glycinifermentans]|uniref:Uncharacterized protein n=1 Tax=Bacillus glycinifermentans TaxID=1664069 RepID=A0A0T6BIQ3_9BACI|nr:hypothetical protein [Bacillus glycinifermentans]ATH93241.1 hypothetical protein COP00_12020 [Bacillus glycinifermentans]KRT88380.1 hypothetical protein AB447_208265 [Bacillus glycinifermentans]MEC0483306.1 hypothetical protein [Bacillus glycinifermentans]